MRIKFLKVVYGNKLKYSTINVKDITGVKINDEDESILEISIGESTTVHIDFKMSGTNDGTDQNLPIDRALVACSLVQQMIDSYESYRRSNKERSEWSDVGYTLRIEKGVGYIQKQADAKKKKKRGQ